MKNEDTQRVEIAIVREQAFIVSTSKILSQFEHVQMKTTLRDDISVALNIKRVLHRVDLDSERERDKKRDRKRERKERDREERDRERRDREQTQTDNSNEA